jgi:penicillin-binding protein 1B
MEETGAITAEEHKATERMRLIVDRSRHTPTPTGGVRYLADYVRQMLGDEASRDLSREGVRVFTTIDPLLQRNAEAALSAGLEDLERRFDRLRRKSDKEKLQAALVVLDPGDGSVRAIVGGRDYATSQFNRVTQARRQPGSAFKPFVYLTGYQQTVLRGWYRDAFTPATRLIDAPLEMKVGGKLWAPANYDNQFRGPVTAQMAMENSLNIPTVLAAQSIGLEEIVATATAAGIASELKPYPSLALGAQEVSPLEIASAYATIANGGVRNSPALVDAVEDPRGVLSFRRVRDPRRALSPEAAFLVTVGLQGAIDHGTGKTVRSLGFTGTAAGKTGTTDDYRDAWFVGYTPDLLALVWVGFDDGESTRLSGSMAALPIWVDLMTRNGAETDDPFDEPAGIEWSQVDPASGGLRRWSCDEGRWMAFVEGTGPRDKCDLHGWFGRWRRQARSGIE